MLLPTKSVLAYARKQGWSAIFEWVEEEKGWFWHANDYPTSWEKRVKVTNIFVPVKKSSASRSAKPKLAKKGDDSSETYLDIVPFEGGLPPIGNIFLESSHPPFAHTRSSKRPIAGKSKSIALWPSTDAPPSSKTRGNKRKTSPPPVSTTTFLCLTPYRKMCLPPVLYYLMSSSLRYASLSSFSF